MFDLLREEQWLSGALVANPLRVGHNILTVDCCTTLTQPARLSLLLCPRRKQVIFCLHERPAWTHIYEVFPTPLVRV